MESNRMNRQKQIENMRTSSENNPGLTVVN